MVASSSLTDLEISTDELKELHTIKATLKSSVVNTHFQNSSDPRVCAECNYSCSQYCQDNCGGNCYDSCLTACQENCSATCVNFTPPGCN